MCGICGKIYHEPGHRPERALLERMCAVMSHRGPDDQGIYLKANVGLGHRRLSILDLSEAGHQPMTNEDGSIWTVFNGEIYNYDLLRKDLESRGHRFASRTDTETIIHLYEERGVECLQDLRGMFAFALWDEKKRRLLLARDRLGKKPLVYAHDGRSLAFASEIKALLQDPELAAEIDPVAIDHYLTYQYIPSPKTVYKSIQKLPPAHYLLCENGSIRIERYWDLSYRNKLPPGSLAEYGEQFLEVLKEAVRVRLCSDVPFGAFLSGGIDSSIVVALMSRIMDRPVKTFSIGFEEEEYDELPHARRVAERYHTDHREFVVRPDVIGILPRLVWHYNEPYADSSAVPTYCLAQLTRQHVTMALNGDGGDECFAGYGRYAEAVQLSRLEKIAGPAGLRLAGAVAGLMPGGRHRGSFLSRLKRRLGAAGEKPERRYVRWLCHFDNGMKRSLCTPAFREQVRGNDSVDLIEALYARADGETFLEKTLYVDVMSYLPEDLLVKVDIASMAHSLEARSPFVDHKVMEWAASLPPEFKLRGRETKYFLKHILGDYLPEDITRRNKMGFGLPIDRWLRESLREMTHDLLLDKQAAGRGYFESKGVKQLLDEHQSGASNHCYRIWNLLCLELWHRMFEDKSISPPGEASTCAP